MVSGDAVAEYCSQADVKERATLQGWRYLADRDHDGQVNTAESGAVDAAIEWAGDEIDVALAPKIEPADARGQSNRYLKNIAIDLSVYRLFTNGGDDATASVTRAYEEAREKLQRIKTGEDVPGLERVYPRPSMITTKVPRAYIPR